MSISAISCARLPILKKKSITWLKNCARRLQVFRPELVHLKGVVEQSSPRKGTTVSLNLRLPSGQMAVQQSAQYPWPL